ncbi:MAG: beta-lactamase family protein [Proteobacteria bacterium]|nr:beta-lactamase family protein [Pseudomonadota bacterium]
MNAESAITRANWRTPPVLRLAFRHIDRILPVATIAHDPARVVALPEAPRDFDALRLNLQGATLTWPEFLRRTHTDGIAVLHDGRLVHEWLDDGMTADTRHIVMSASKSMVGLLCGALAARGLLDPSAPVAHYVPEVADSGYRGASLRDLMDMRAQPGFSEAELQRYAWATNWDVPPDGVAAAGLHEFFAALPPRATTHGGPFRYLSPNTDLLGWAIERAGGRPFAALAGELLWAPTGAQHDAAITVDRDGAPRATGGLSMTLRDLARVGQFVLDADGAMGAWIADILDHGDPAAWAQGDFAQAFGRRMHYRSGWYVMRDEPRMLFAMGIHGQHLFVDPAHRLVVAKLSAQPQALDAQATGWTMRAVAELRRALG